MCQESIDLWFGHLGRVADLMEIYEPLDPLTIRLLSPAAVVAATQCLAKLLQEPWFSCNGQLLVLLLPF
jgi:hypothetical protein